MFPQVALMQTSPHRKSVTETPAIKKKAYKTEKSKYKHKNSIQILTEMMDWKLSRELIYRDAPCNNVDQAKIKYFVKVNDCDLVIFQTTIKLTTGSKLLCCGGNRGFSAMVLDRKYGEIIFFRKRIFTDDLQIFYPLKTLSMMIVNQSKACATKLKFAAIEVKNGDHILTLCSHNRVNFVIHVPHLKNPLGTITKNFMHGELYQVNLVNQLECIQKIALLGMIVLCDYVYDY